MVRLEQSVLYQPLAVDIANDAISTGRAKYRRRSALAKNLLGLVVGLFLGLLVVSRTGFIHWVRFDSNRASGRSCSHHRLGHPDAAHLPTHYTLPSGDKIPSVALGTAAAAVNITSSWHPY